MNREKQEMINEIKDNDDNSNNVINHQILI